MSGRRLHCVINTCRQHRALVAPTSAHQIPTPKSSDLLHNARIYRKSPCSLHYPCFWSLPDCPLRVHSTSSTSTGCAEVRARACCSPRRSYLEHDYCLAYFTEGEDPFDRLWGITETSRLAVMRTLQVSPNPLDWYLNHQKVCARTTIPTMSGSSHTILGRFPDPWAQGSSQRGTSHTYNLKQCRAMHSMQHHWATHTGSKATP